MDDLERNLGTQPIARLMAAHGLAPHDLVAASTARLTHKMVQRACKGRRLTPNVMAKVRAALNAAAAKDYALTDLFDYASDPRREAEQERGVSSPEASPAPSAIPPTPTER